ncbi:MAG: cation-transporting P-type ATPase, partial [Burkholderiaceae bacterium]
MPVVHGRHGNSQPGPAHRPATDHNPSHEHQAAHHHHHEHERGHESPCCACEPQLRHTGGDAAAAVAPPGMSGPDVLMLRIPAMDCLVEENQIRRLLDGRADVQRLHFDLAGRTLAIDASEEGWNELVSAIEQGGFKVETLAAPPTAEAARAQSRRELWRLLAALTLAGLAETLGFAGMDALVWQAAGMALAALAIAMAGLAVFRKGLAALFKGQLNIHALMTVAVTGAFLIGEWPEAAMVMALYSLAELIEARSVDRARN